MKTNLIFIALCLALVAVLIRFHPEQPSQRRCDGAVRGLFTDCGDASVMRDQRTDDLPGAARINARPNAYPASPLDR